ncbi:hypothetical protein PoB_007596700 [Plakobranchus ocellatus]|uniref:Uncharacterized protein n=1 Tax=Plakobranchus ocellatus TaxID=259542 RepID=A0AAV4DZJ1_9GAST|nr:hypothetical protein PoB_007596700 [Plakobranchus ocellatus]
MSPCPDERQSIGDNLPWSPLTTRGNHGATVCRDFTLEENEVEDSRRRGRWDDSAGKEVGIEDKARWRKRDVTMY